MKLFRKTLIILLMVVMLLNTIPCTINVSALEEGAYSYYINKDHATIYGFSSNISGNITIPSFLGSYPVDKISSQAFSYCSIEGAIIPNGITEIGDNAFYKCDRLAYVILPDSISRINQYTFSGCRKLKNIIIPNRVKSMGAMAFQFSGLTSIIIQNSMDLIETGAFYGCYDLNDVYFMGSESEWKKIKIESNNSWLLESNIHFHDQSLIKEIVLPTCTKTGIKIFICELGDEYTEEIPATGHQHTTTINAKEATCTETGYTGDTYCSDCETVIADGETIEKLAHTIVTDKAVEPTCTETGLTEGTHCSVCNNVLTAQEVVNAVGHKPTAGTAILPTCTSTGLTAGTYCSVCGVVIAKQETIFATGHIYGEWKTVKVATHLEEGSKEKICSSCGDVVTEKIDKIAEHSYSTVITNPTCTTEGYTTYTCICGDSYVGDQVEPTDHNNVNGHCTNCGHDFTNGCKCNCHKSGFTLFIWKIGNFFRKIFKKNEVCGCGVHHW